MSILQTSDPTPLQMETLKPKQRIITGAYSHTVLSVCPTPVRELFMYQHHLLPQQHYEVSTIVSSLQVNTHVHTQGGQVTSEEDD